MIHDTEKELVEYLASKIY